MSESLHYIQPPLGLRYHNERPIDHELPVRQENEDGSVEGYVGEFLKKYYLGGYYDFLHQKYPTKEYLSDIHKAVKDIFAPLLDPQGKYSKDVGDIYFTGELPRAIADEMNPDYWLHFADLQEEVRVNKNSQNPQVRQFCESHLGFPKSPDLDITFRDINLEKVSSWFKEIYGIKDEQVTKSEGRELYKLFSNDKFIVEIDSGPLLKKPDIVLMVINIKDVLSGDTVFHLDVGEFPLNAQATVSDTRVIHATEIHDKCQAKMSFRDDRLYYSMTPEAIQVLSQPDHIPTVGKNAESVAEMVTRSARIAGMHERGDFDDTGFLPQLDSETAFRIGEIFRATAATNKDIDPNILLFILKEQILIFRQDPYQIVQVLRDSYLGAIKPDSIIARLTPFQWDQILRSNSFAIAGRGQDLVPQFRRDAEYLKLQRRLYRTGTDENGQRYFDGLKRFIHALVEIQVLPEDAKADIWGSFFDLWINKRVPVIQIITPEELQVSVPVLSYARVTDNGNTIYIFRRDGLEINENEVDRIAVRLADNIPTRPDNVDAVIDALMQIRERADPKLLSTINTYLKLKDTKNLNQEQKIQLSEAKNQVYSLARLLIIIQQNPSALTPRHLDQAYKNIRGRFRKISFPKALLTLKTLGFVSLYQKQLVTMVRHERRAIERYFALPTHITLHKFKNLLLQNNRNQILERYNIEMDKLNKSANPATIKTLTNIANFLDAKGISLEALESFTDFDFNRLQQYNFFSSYFAQQAQCFREALRWVNGVKYIEWQNIPDVYKITFKSLAGERLLRQVRSALSAN